MPPGVPYIIGNEAAERFSFYGMRSILIIFMTQYLVTSSGATDHMNAAEARQNFALFVSAVYFVPILGAILAEGFIGKYLTILCLSVVYCFGHFALAINDTRMGLIIGLGLIALGSGGIKPCVSANVGDQFGESNKHLLSKVFGWFYFAINAGSFISTIACPFLLADPRFGPRWAFGIPGIAMVIATIFFWAGRKKFVHVPPGGLGFVRQLFSREGFGAIGRLAIVYIFVAVFWSLWDQSSGGSWTLQAEKLDLHWMGMNLLASQVQTANPIMILLFIPLVNYLVYPAIDRFFPLTPLRKIGIGLFLTAGSYVVIWHIQQLIDAGGKPSVNWQFLAYAILTLGEAMVSITGLEFSYTQAPNKMKSAVMALWLFTVSIGNLFTAGVNYFIRNADGSVKMNDQQYFLFFAGLMLVTACIFVFVATFYRGKTYLQSQEPVSDLAAEPSLS
ncbi:MAG: proton-dependent oligopeptide transporter family [Chthoniobacteraceae bacterium]|nr:proton-dependent oligopeptide transporter family [Chthoniobacteraceae bacterium]